MNLLVEDWGGKIQSHDISLSSCEMGITALEKIKKENYYKIL